MNSRRNHDSNIITTKKDLLLSTKLIIIIRFLLIVLILPLFQQQRHGSNNDNNNRASVVVFVVEGHFIWADTTSDNDEQVGDTHVDNTANADTHVDTADVEEEEEEAVIVTFSEKAGVHDKLIGILSNRVRNMKCYYAKNSTPKTDSSMALTEGYNNTVSLLSPYYHQYDVPLSLSDDKTSLNGKLKTTTTSSTTSRSNNDGNNNGPKYVYGYLDFGPFEKFHDLQYSFGTQLYESEDDYEKFFVPLLKEMDNNNGDDDDDEADDDDNDRVVQRRRITQPPSKKTTATIVLKNCGGNASYRFDVAGFHRTSDNGDGGGPLGVCLYRKGGLEIGCGTFPLSSSSSSNNAVVVAKEKEEEEKEQNISTRRSSSIVYRRRRLELSLLRNNGNNDKNSDDDEDVNRKIQQDDGNNNQVVITEETQTPYLLYALANQTVIDKDSGNVTIIFASTSVYFEGTCNKSQ